MLGPGSGSIIALMCGSEKTKSKVPEAYFHVPLNYIKNYIPGQTLTWDSKDDASSKIARARIINNKLEVDYPIILGEEPSVNYRNFNCYDVNGDGFDDIVVNPIINASSDMSNKQIKPIVYLSTGDGSFAVAKFPSVTYEILKSSYYNQSSTEVGDFDGDGFLDFIVYPNTPGIDKPRLDTTMQFFKGKRKID